jgi:hypothetical protein
MEGGRKLREGGEIDSGKETETRRVVLGREGIGVRFMEEIIHEMPLTSI